MNVAYVTSLKPGETDRLLSELAKTLIANNKNLAGIVKVLDYEPSYGNGCDMKVQVLPNGAVIKITQSLGSGSDACRLDPSAIAEAVSQVEATSMQEADLFILNKFGPEEANGHGFCNVIGAALEQGVPVLVGAGGGSVEAFEAFAEGMAERLADNELAIHDWVAKALPN